MKKIVDERQELELMKVERTGFWVVLIALAADIAVKILFFNVPLKQLVGENIALFAGCITVITGCARRGLWDYCSKPGLKNA